MTFFSCWNSCFSFSIPWVLQSPSTSDYLQLLMCPVLQNLFLQSYPQPCVHVHKALVRVWALSWLQQPPSSSVINLFTETACFLNVSVFRTAREGYWNIVRAVACRRSYGAFGFPLGTYRISLCLLLTSLILCAHGSNQAPPGTQQDWKSLLGSTLLEDGFLPSTVV